MMTRGKAILASLIPALVLLVSLDCFSRSFTSCGCDATSGLLPAGGHGTQNQPSADNSFDQAVRRWSRRPNVQPGTDEFSSPAVLAAPQSALPAQSDRIFNLPLTNLELAQAWQFHWRTASEPRAPSLASQISS
jgi:hypothetical protein